MNGLTRWLAGMLLVAGCRNYDALRVDGGVPGPDAGGVGPDAGGVGPDAGVGNPDMAVLCGAALLCDGFEASAFASHWSVSQEGPATITLDTTHVHRGAQSVHVHVPARTLSDPTTYANLSFSPHMLGQDLYVRANFYRPSENVQEFQLAYWQVDGSSSNGIILDSEFTGTTIYEIAGDGATISSNQVGTLKLDDWTCVEWHLGRSNDGFVTNYRIEGVQQLPMDAQITTAFSDTLVLTFGAFASNQTTTLNDFWFDDVIVDTVPIGCTR